MRVLFVCTGNTCRSPMAESLFNKAAKEQGLDAQAVSRGLYVTERVISVNCSSVLSENDCSVNVTPSAITKEDVENADIIFGITERHAKAVMGTFPEYSEKVCAFPTDISDPYGGNLEMYRICFEEIKSCIYEILNLLAKKQKETTYETEVKTDDNISESFIEIRPFTEQYLDDMAEIEAQCFSEPWSRKALSEVLDKDYARYFCAVDTQTDKAVGYAGLFISVDMGAINNVGVLKEYRRTGIGSRLLSTLLEDCKGKGVTLFTLEVRESNVAARRLYEAFNFKEVGIRKGYYRNPLENAVLYNLEI